jgi:hypothetical protein
METLRAMNQDPRRGVVIPVSFAPQWAKRIWMPIVELPSFVCYVTPFRLTLK